MLQQQDALCDDVTVARVVFHEITESSIKNALKAPREIDVNLVHAYLARRALDYLIGFNVSPLLWRKLPGCQSAGRVQSAALALICDREMEIDEFKPQEYWTVDIELNKKELGLQVNVNVFPAHLTHFDSKKLNQFSISSHTQAKDVEQQLNIAELLVLKSKVNKTRKNPPTPYITSTLQQDAANKLNFSSTYTMKVCILNELIFWSTVASKLLCCLLITISIIFILLSVLPLFIFSKLDSSSSYRKSEFVNYLLRIRKITIKLYYLSLSCIL